MSVKSRHIYNSKWELTYRWLKASGLGNKHYYCSCCRKDLSLGAGLANVEMHATREKHMKNEAIWEEELLFPPAVDDVGAVADEDADNSLCKCPLDKTDREAAASTPVTSTTPITVDSTRQTFEFREAENQLNEAITILHNVTKRDLENKDDECDLFGKMLAKKLRKLPEMDREVLMHDINGMVMNNMRHRLNSNPRPTNQVNVVRATKIITMDQTIQHLSASQPLTATANSNLHPSSSLPSNATVVRFTPLYSPTAQTSQGIVAQPTEPSPNLPVLLEFIGNRPKC